MHERHRIHTASKHSRNSRYTLSQAVRPRGYW